MRRFRLFFSNRSSDQERVDALQDRLTALLPNLPFEDVSRAVPFSQDWKIAAADILESCDALVCVVGTETHLSEPIDWEIREAHRVGKPLLVARLTPDCRAPDCCEELGVAIEEWQLTNMAARIGEILVSRALFMNHDWSGGAPDSPLIWNQYNLMVQSWESLITRRQTVNTLYVSASAALLAGIGVLISSMDKTGETWGVAGAGVLALLGAALSFNWRRTVLSYGTLSSAKAKVINALETHMPARLFDAEWRVLEAKRYKSTTETDRQSALFFMLLFGALSFVAAGIVVGSFL